MQIEVIIAKDASEAARLIKEFRREGAPTFVILTADVTKIRYPQGRIILDFANVRALLNQIWKRPDSPCPF